MKRQFELILDSSSVTPCQPCERAVVSERTTEPLPTHTSDSWSAGSVSVTRFAKALSRSTIDAMEQVLAPCLERPDAVVEVDHGSTTLFVRASPTSLACVCARLGSTITLLEPPTTPQPRVVGYCLRGLTPRSGAVGQAP